MESVNGDVKFILDMPGAWDFGWSQTTSGLSEAEKNEAFADFAKRVTGKYNSLRDEILEKFDIKLLGVSSGLLLGDDRFNGDAEQLKKVFKQTLKHADEKSVQPSCIVYVDYGDEPTSGGQMMYFFDGNPAKLFDAAAARQAPSDLSYGEFYLIESGTPIHLNKETRARIEALVVTDDLSSSERETDISNPVAPQRGREV